MTKTLQDKIDEMENDGLPTNNINIVIQELREEIEKKKMIDIHSTLYSFDYNRALYEVLALIGEKK